MKEKFFNVKYPLSYNKFLYYLVGGRGIGKTYSTKRYIIKRFLNKGEQFVWLRRYKTEVGRAKDGFFNKISNEFNKSKFEVKGKKAFINNKVAGFFLPLSVFDSEKGTDVYDNVTTIVFDEYIIKDTTNKHYLKDEVVSLLDVIETIGRTRKNLKVIILSNNISSVNPLAILFNIDFTKTNKIVNDLIYAELLETSEELKQEKSKSLVGQISQKYLPKYYNYNVENQNLADDYSFMFDKLPTKLEQRYYLTIEDKDIFIYHDSKNMVIYANDYGNKSLIHFIDDYNKVNESTIFFDKSSDVAKYLKHYIFSGKCYFKNLEIKNLLQRFLII